MSLGILMQGISQLLILLAICFQVKLLFPVGIMGYLFFFYVGLGGILFVYQVDIVPAELLPVVQVILMFSAFFFSLFSLPIINAVGIFALVLFLTTVTFVTWFLFEGFAVETKEKTKYQIQKELNIKKFLKIKN